MQFMQMFGRAMEQLVLSSQKSDGIDDRAGGLNRAEEALLSAQHAANFIRIALEVTSVGLKSGESRYASSGEFLVRMISVPSVVDWISRSIESLSAIQRIDGVEISSTEATKSLRSMYGENVLAHSASSMTDQQRRIRNIHEILLQIVENLICGVYLIVDVANNRVSIGANERAPIIDLRTRGAIDQLVKLTEALPNHSFSRTVVRWLRELVEVN